MSHDLIVHTSDANFENDVVKADVPTLVDFWAPWCGPCKMIAPVLDEMAAEYQGRLKIVKVNVDDHPAAAQKFGVRGITTLILFKGGNIEATRVGAQSKSQLSAFVDSHL